MDHDVTQDRLSVCGLRRFERRGVQLCELIPPPDLSQTEHHLLRSRLREKTKCEKSSRYYRLRSIQDVSRAENQALTRKMASAASGMNACR